MTEYWVSQGNKWCEYCKIYIANNATSIRTHEFGQRHKDNVAKKLAALRKDNAVKEKEKVQAAKDLEKIEAQARKSYAKDLAAIQKADVTTKTTDVTNRTVARPTERTATSGSATSRTSSDEWTYDEKTGYHFNAATGYYYDPNSGLYYSDILGKWTTQEEALKASEKSKLASGSRTEIKVTPGPVLAPKQNSRSTTKVSTGVAIEQSQLKQTSVSSVKPQVPIGVGRGVASSLQVGKRKREDKPVPVSNEEAAALAAREAARKRTQEREKALLGLYQAY